MTSTLEHWASPLVASDARRLHEALFPYFECLYLLLLEKAENGKPVKDQLVVRGMWDEAQNLLRIEEGGDLAKQNRVWREFVVAVWKLLERYWKAEMQAAAALRARGRA